MNKTTLAAKTKTELLKIAQRLGLRGITTLKKDELAQKINSAKQQKKTNTMRKSLNTATAAVRKFTDVVRRRAIRKRGKTAVPAPAPAPKIARKPKAASSEEQPVTATAAGATAAHKFDVTPKAKAPQQKFTEESLGELPEAYGTGKLFIVARDPNWLYAYWDLTGPQMSDARKRASDGRLVLRLFEKNVATPLQELTLHQDSRNWYISGVRASTTYSGQLGYWRRDGRFHVLSHSREATTPSAVVSADTTARFATIPVDVPFEELLSIVRSYGHQGAQLADALHRLQAQGAPFPFQVGIEVGPWTAEQAAALEQELGGDVLRRLQTGSFEISEWLRRRLLENISSGGSGGFSPGGASWSAAPGGKGFWFAVNAEVIIYGATEPDAKVTIDGKPVALNRDGTFQFHYAFPDGQFRLPVVAGSAAGDDRRAADLSFERKTNITGEVGAVKPSVQRPKPA